MHHARRLVVGRLPVERCGIDRVDPGSAEVLDRNRYPGDSCTVTSTPPPREPEYSGYLDAVAKKLRLPFGTPEFVDRIATGTVNEAGRRTLYTLITTWDLAGGGPFAASTIGGAVSARTVDMLQKLFMNGVFDRVLAVLGADDVKFRASLCASQLVGLGMIRYAVKAEPIASMDVDRLVDAMAPTLQRYLTGPLN